MSYSASTLPRSAPPIRDVLESPMPSRSSGSPFRRRPPRPLPPFLRCLDPECSCKLTMRPHCLVGKLPGCRERRQTKGKRCGCAVALLPKCVAGDGVGCADRQLGKHCGCAKAMMPSCFALGCEDRKEGRNCQCPRTPGEPCQHVVALFALYKDWPRERISKFLVRWAARLEKADYETYMEPPAPEPDVATTQEQRVTLREMRLNLGLGLWNEKDVLAPIGGREEELQTRCMVDFLRLVRKQEGGPRHAA